MAVPDVVPSIDDSEVDASLSVSPADVSPASELSFCRNVFVPLTTACRYTCSYCTYYDDPGEATLMAPESVRELLRTGAQAGCTEALFTFGDTPDARYEGIYAQLAEMGHDSIHSYLRAMCEVALSEGLLPHSNPGDLESEEMAGLADVNASMGVMLETTADVAAHRGSRQKTPEQRLRTIANAGRLGVPFTTGILVGIGETRRDRAHSLCAIRALHDRYDHIQEVLVQPVVPNERWQAPGPDVGTLRDAVAMARACLPEEVSIQVPPNLAPVAEVLDCGVDDLGGVSPVTDDHINPEYAWPALRELDELAEKAGVPLRERLPVYEHFLPDGLGANGIEREQGERGEDSEDSDTAIVNEWVSERIGRAIAADWGAGERYRAVLRGTSLDDR
ncbi:7,8-didemethyl-8-hydroxy-5-deazariboflavin synthase subunit CofG [Halobacteriales archaeon QS_3_64_16]|nr:MAG: 7,8-didemethyl-8-hydroxy-5-deazariboflavin synthase subunit CofG [Halobacteriales archaeon QS_3_64_16]